ncbi:hypothetical protein E4T42_04728 [Aureobasidium subglaciale]|uniref:Uncharacterized protein n=1 Tax=Aureobasidium subglaciale (strain EXF-2481) TaxID=1043005 RepID=A0A074Y192_AURSE|nr:uncharacterized protein AUEXF2481DRAFT_8432 [Aureobasidium subglaciale EXF-2481]KAI5200440.1 hypothetical protein E4T38_06548 [Aureobasidium subglaciale]KAI5218989.1 hypothetical protein E4T40_06667 [Aureobasidium subglaciale]KAI5222709.1 hypothetical protein E4T41_06488 [Aureobasidium subglaciale]KAI5250775.1 hypothetical protein E4T42_04728 [Aureobasidium subglaciale]KAI5260205.1 hypothetical protein E4T46_06200 [Aureobasidium subglaciale]
MPAAQKAAVAIVQVVGVYVPMLAGSVILEQKVIKEKVEMETKWLIDHNKNGKPKPLAANELPSAPKSG